MEQTKQINQEERTLLAQAESLYNQLQIEKVVSQESYDYAGKRLLEIKEVTKRIEDWRTSKTKPLDELKGWFMDLVRKPLAQLSDARAYLQRERISYEQEQDRIRREEEARIAELNRKEAERLAKRAEKAAEQGKTEKADELQAQAQATASITPTIAPLLNKTTGVKKRTNWKFTITDANLIPKEYLCPDQEKIGAVVRGTKGTIAIPGVKVYPEYTEY
jgi:hypothetical protein